MLSCPVLGAHTSSPLLARLRLRLQVSRSLAACQGALLLVDASQGVQAQVRARSSRAHVTARQRRCHAGMLLQAPLCLQTVGLDISGAALAATLANSASHPLCSVYTRAQSHQTQTVANFYLAFEQGLALLPVLNKIDLPSADPGAVVAQMGASFDVAPLEVLAVSAKTGQGVRELLSAIVE